MFIASVSRNSICSRIRSAVTPSRVAVAGLLLSVIGFLPSACGSGSEAPKYPDAFDPRVADLVDFVEAVRGLAFLHPVFVDFLDEEAFVAHLTERDALSGNIGNPMG